MTTAQAIAELMAAWNKVERIVRQLNPTWGEERVYAAVKRVIDGAVGSREPVTTNPRARRANRAGQHQMTTLDIIQGQQAALLQTPPDLETWTTLERRRIARESASKGGRKVTDAKREANRRRAIKYWAEVRAGIRPPRRAQQ